MAAGVTYETIANTTLTTATSSITFTNISGSYTDLILVLNTAIASGYNGESVIRFNSDTGTSSGPTTDLGIASSGIS